MIKKEKAKQRAMKQRAKELGEAMRTLKGEDPGVGAGAAVPTSARGGGGGGSSSGGVGGPAVITKLPALDLKAARSPSAAGSLFSPIRSGKGGGAL